MDKKRLLELAGVKSKQALTENDGMSNDYYDDMLGNKKLARELRTLMDYADQNNLRDASDWIKEMWVEHKQGM